ncbi:MAG TPA: SIS domain-containing protein [Terracidiphilus sp.]|jgi:glucosamine--fructose-6-phosphate aminotransferase (isomerizing)
MTKLFNDILREPQQLSACVTRMVESQSELLQEAANFLRREQTTYVVGIGSSWNAALAVVTLLNSAGHPAIAADASELLYFASIPRGATCIVLSRSGRSIEIVRLLDKFQAAETSVIAITNTSDSPLAQQAKITFLLECPFDHMVSISMYSMLALVGGLIAETCKGTDLKLLGGELTSVLAATDAQMKTWVTQIRDSQWPREETPVYFLARGTSMASCHEARLLWEEAAKRPATALSTGSFRHGSQEIIRPGIRIGLWLQGDILRDEDLQLAADLQEAGASVLLVGSKASNAAADIVFDLPLTPLGWEFLIDIIPLQLAAEFSAGHHNEDCDGFRFCSYVVEKEGGLVGGRTGRS